MVERMEVAERMEVVERVDVTPRPYQQELLEAALEENTIVSLGTGAGKTYIGVMLIKELSPQIVKSWKEDDAKRTIFLVTTVPLVKQQADYIARHTSLTVGQYIGSMKEGSIKLENWPKDIWEKQFEKNHVLVMTMTIFKNLLLDNFIQFRRVNLIVFDECHHAVKKHDYVQITCHFKDNYDQLDPTRVLGLTASLIPSKRKPGELAKGIEELEQTLGCRAQTAKDLTEVAKYATNPDEITINFYPSSVDSEIGKLKSILEEVLLFVSSFSKQLKDTELYKMVKLNFDDCLHILTNLGIWCAHDYACRAVDDIAEEIKECDGYFRTQEEEMVIHHGHIKMKNFVKESCPLAVKETGAAHTTHKVKKLLHHLSDDTAISGEIGCQSSSIHGLLNGDSSNGGSDSKLCGIIFVERRTTAALLRDLICKQSREAPNLKHIRCECVVGHNDSKTGTYLCREAKMSVKRQEDVLSKFRRGDINLLVSTSVVEEGVDVPKCNMVVRFDFPQNFRSYVQSKGRARAKKSQYVLLVPENEAETLIPQLKDYNALVKELEEVCHDRHVDKDEEILKQLRNKVEPYRNAYGATATIDSSVSKVHRYCQKLPKDSFTVLSPHFETSKRRIHDRMEPNPYRIAGQKEEFQTTLNLPMSSLVKDPIKGDWFPTKKLADKSAALRTVRKLDQMGELDQHLRPVTRKEDSDDEEEDEDRKQEKTRPHAGTEKARSYYQNKVSPLLQSCQPVCGADKNYLYMLLIKDKLTCSMHYSFPELCMQLSFGILTSTPLPYLKFPEFSIYDGEKEYCVQVVRYHMKVSLDKGEIEQMKKAHHALFTHVLSIKPDCLKPTFEAALKDYLIVPIQVILPECIDGQQASSQLEAIIDAESVRLLVELGHKATDPNTVYERVQWPVDVKVLKNAIIMANHHKKKALYEVIKISETVNFSSPFPDPEVANTYQSYYDSKYKISLADVLQPALVCKRLGTAPAYLQQLTSRFKQSTEQTPEKRDTRGKIIEFFPELCRIYPIPSNLWKLARCLPSILWRIESFVTVDILRSRILHESTIGLCPDGSELTTCVKVTGSHDVTTGDLSSQKYFPGSGSDDASVFSFYNYDFSEDPLCSPGNGLFLQALTSKSAMDCIDLERLETLGDSFLKFSTSVFLYCNRQAAHEGRLSSARSRRVENFNLFYLAKCKGIADFVMSRAFDARQMWVPPGYQFVCGHNLDQASSSAVPSSPRKADSLSEDERYYCYHKLTDKGVADSIESLIGAYLSSGGILAGLKFMKWVGIKITTATDAADPSDESAMEEEEGEIIDDFDDLFGFPASTIPPQAGNFNQPRSPKQQRLSPHPVALLIGNSSKILREFFSLGKSWWESQVIKEDDTFKLNQLLHKALADKKMEDIIGWKFKNRGLLLQALTHASYTRNRLTDSYQRLEFLGDAILDYLVTCHIYKKFPNYTPGQISCMRSALVDNISFADMAVNLELHKVLLYASPSLMKQIELFLKSRNDDGVDCDEVCYHSSSFSSISAEDQGGSSDPANEYDEEVEDISPPKVLGDILESLAGAIFVDSGFCLESVWKIFQPLFNKKIDSYGGAIPLTPLQELREKVLDISMECKMESQRRVSYVISVVMEGTSSFRVRAVGKTKAAAKNAAARAVLRRIKRPSL